MSDKLKTKMTGRALGTQPAKKKAPKMIIGDTKSAGPLVKEQTIKLSPIEGRGTGADPVTIGGNSAQKQKKKYIEPRVQRTR